MCNCVISIFSNCTSRSTLMIVLQFGMIVCSFYIRQITISRFIKWLMRWLKEAEEQPCNIIIIRSARINRCEKLLDNCDRMSQKKATLNSEQLEPRMFPRQSNSTASSKANFPYQHAFVSTINSLLSEVVMQKLVFLLSFCFLISAKRSIKPALVANYLTL